MEPLISQAMVPVIVFIGAGLILRRRLAVDFGPVSRVAIYVFSPALVFSSLVAPQLSVHDLVGIITFAAVMVIAAILVSRVTGRLIHARGPEQPGLDLVSAFSNSANLGLPLVAFSLGRPALHAAVVFVLTQVVAVNTIGAYLAGRSGVNPKAAFSRMIRLPSLWAMAIAMMAAATHLRIPGSFLTAASFGGQAYAPTVLLVLGGALADWPKKERIRPPVWSGSLIRLVIMPLIAVGVVELLAVTVPTARALVLQIAMPVAVNTLILSKEFGAGPDQVSQSIALSTLGGIVTIPLCLLLLPFVR